MKFIGLEKLSAVLKYVLMITFAGGLLVTIFLSYVLKHYFLYYFINNEAYYYACMAIFTPCGILALVIIFNLIKIIGTVDRKNPFVYANANSLRNIACCCIAISVLFIVLFAMYPTILAFAVAYIFLIGGLACFVFSRLFRKAVDYKQENDLTI